MRINSTGQRCVDEGWQDNIEGGKFSYIRFVRLVDLDNNVVGESLAIAPEELVTELIWDGRDYVPVGEFRTL